MCDFLDVRDLEFKDLKAFKLAMVAKQCWHLVKYFDSLFA